MAIVPGTGFGMPHLSGFKIASATRLNACHRKLDGFHVGMAYAPASKTLFVRYAG